MMAPGQGSQSALAAVDTTSQLRWTSDDANLFKTQYEGLGILQARSQGNLFIKYFRKLLTLRDGAPLVSEVDISLVENCKIIGFALAGKGQFGTFNFDEPKHFNWKVLLTKGLSAPQLAEVMLSPITSVKLKPSQTPVAINQVHGRQACSKSVEWAITFGREDGTQVTMQPSLAGRPMKPVTTQAGHVPAVAERSRHRVIVGSPQIKADGTTFLYGGLEDNAWKQHLEEEMASRAMQAIILPFTLDPSTDPQVLAIGDWLQQCIVIGRSLRVPVPACEFDQQPVPARACGSEPSGSSSSTDARPARRYTATTILQHAPMLTPTLQANDTDSHQEMRAAYNDLRDGGWTWQGHDWWQDKGDHDGWQNSAWRDSESGGSGGGNASTEHNALTGSEHLGSSWRNLAGDDRSTRRQ